MDSTQKKNLKIRAEAVDIDELSLHSFEDKEGVTFSKEFIKRFSVVCSELCNGLISEISKCIFSEMCNSSVPLVSLEVLIRRAIFPIAHFYWNQVARIQALTLKNENLLLSVYKYKYENKVIEIPEDFEEKVLSQEFNEFFIYYLSRIWKFEISKDKPTQTVNFDFHKKTSTKNNLFTMGKRIKLVNRFIRLIEKIFGKLNLFSKFPILTFANAETAMRLRGMYLFHFRSVMSNWKFSEFKRDYTLRNRIFGKNLAIPSDFNSFLREIGLTKRKIEIAQKLFKRFLISSFPIQFLEGLDQNYRIALARFRVNDLKAVFSSGDGDSFSTFLIACAKGNGFKIIKAQHGGHYGYYIDNRPALDIELPNADIFLTWGWTRMHEGAQLEHVECVPLPSPWLSERKKYWKKLRFDIPKEYDILWMPQMMKRFTGAPQGASSIRRDVIDAFSKYMIDFIQEASKKKIRVYAKPYNAITVALLSNTYARMKEIGGEYFTCSDHFDKGLSKKTLEKCSLVLWDQPGTGFLECLSGSIPTMILWDRIYCEEEEWVKDDFLALEKVGVIHRSIFSLIQEYERFAKSSKEWMENSERKETITFFCKKFALVDDRWWIVWRSYLKQLN
ncbi:transferase [Leptospira santarosai]|uniref:transferase n=1 Tax=Leptospira santarosai TaxID=28183 RepID=UPI0002977DBE|nr:transferase [Leptospira santarosai]EKS07869.1 transferase, TIGR04331 family [Leptospira santarosai str. JET]